MFKKILYTALAIGVGIWASDLLAQGERGEPVQISGIVVTNDSVAQTIPYAHVVLK